MLPYDQGDAIVKCYLNLRAIFSLTILLQPALLLMVTI